MFAVPDAAEDNHFRKATNLFFQSRIDKPDNQDPL